MKKLLALLLASLLLLTLCVGGSLAVSACGDDPNWETDSEHVDYDGCAYHLFYHPDGEEATLQKVNDTTRESITIPAKIGGVELMYIDGDAFEGCDNLANIFVEDSNEYFCSIDGVVYSKDKRELVVCPPARTSFVVPDEVTYIRSSAFSSCDRLSAIHFGSNVAEIDSRVFKGLTNLESFSVAEDNQNLCKVDGALYSKDMTTLHWYPLPSSNTFAVPDGVKTIGEYALYNCKGLTKISIPPSVTKIQSGALSDCKGMQVHCSDLSAWCRIEFLFNPLTNGGIFYLDNQKVTDLVIPKDIKAIYDVFTGYKELKSVTFPDGLETIGWCAFAGCTGLETVVLPKSLDTLGTRAFENCTGLTKVQFPAIVNSIGDWAFEECTNLATVVMPRAIETMGHSAFYNCKSLTSIVLPEVLTEIKSNTFYGCSSLQSVTFTDDLETIDFNAFKGCTKLKKITISDHVDIDSSAFKDTAYYKDSSNWVNGLLYVGNHLVYSKSTNPEHVAVRKGTVSISADAFENHKKLTSIALPKSLVKIGYLGSSKLKNVYYAGDEEDKNHIEILGLASAFHKATWHYNCNFATITTQPKSTSVKVNQKATVSLKAAGDGLTYAWYVCDVQEPGKYYLSPSKTTNTYDITLTPDRVGRKAYCIVTDKYGNSVKSNTVTLGEVKTPASELKVSLSKTSYTYNGKVQKPSVTVKDSKGNVLKKNTDYTVTYASGCKNAGTYKVTIKMKGNYTGTVTKSFNINPINVSECKVSLSTTSYTYNGSVRKPAVTVKNHKGTKLTTSSYTVTYASGRKNVGTYKVTVKMKGNYTGTKTVTFKINPVKTSISSLTAGSKKLTVKWSKKTAQVSGYEVQYSTSKSFKSYKTKTVSSYKTVSASLTGLKAKTTYYVRVRTYKMVDGQKVYSAWSTVKCKKTN